MPLTKPYYRIMRPKTPDRNYTADIRYANDRIQLGRAYKGIEKDMVRIFDYIEPGDDNKDTYSFELYSLLLRACTEVELNCKLILDANKYSKNSDKYKMKDYIKIEKSSMLSRYHVQYNNWRKEDGSHGYFDIVPFESFGNPEPSAPKWYQEYNEVKHDRERKLQYANFSNCMSAIAGILVLLYSQFGSNCIPRYQGQLVWIDEDSYDDPIDSDVIFKINPPSFRVLSESGKMIVKLYK